MVKYTLAFFLITVHSLFLIAQDYHVAKSGNDSNNGTFESPFLTISKAAKVALPGSSDYCARRNLSRKNFP